MSNSDFTIPASLHLPKYQLRRKINITGRTFTRLFVLGAIGNTASGSAWLCRCDCGKFLITSASHLTRGKTRSCGCWGNERTAIRSYRHGHRRGGRKTRLLRIHHCIKQRCLNPKYHAYPDYGGRGITIQESWKDAKTFISDVLTLIGDAPSTKYSIDRIDNNGHYEAGNVRWATAKEQARNQRRNHRILIGGHIKCLAEWLEITGTVAFTFRKRRKRGLSLRESLGISPAHDITLYG